MQNGTYVYLLNNKPTGIIETFTIEILPDGTKLTTATRDASVYGTTFTVTTTEKDNKLNEFAIIFKKESLIVAIYKFSNKSLQFQRHINGEIIDNKTLELPKNCVIFPLMRCFQGKTILQVAENQALTTVLVPNIINPNDTSNLLKPTFDERTAQNIGTQGIWTHSKNAGLAFDCNIYRYISKHYDDKSKFWLNNEGLLIKYTFHQTNDKLWTVCYVL